MSCSCREHISLASVRKLRFLAGMTACEVVEGLACFVVFFFFFVFCDFVSVSLATGFGGSELDGSARVRWEADTRSRIISALFSVVKVLILMRRCSSFFSGVGEC